MNEFNIIDHYFNQNFPAQSNVILGIGDDAALCTVPAGMQLAISVDTLVEGIHFPKNTHPQDIGYKALAVNLSDLAAMGATPVWMTLALSCPQMEQNWLKQFTAGLLELAQLYQISLIGGDTTRGTLTISIQIMGFVPQQQALQRNSAQINDDIYVTGTLGDAGLGLASIQNKINLATDAKKFTETRLNRPTPQVEVGKSLRNIATSAIDISDGLAADLGHILTASNVGASLQLKNLPLSTAMQTNLSLETAWNLALTAGDDYELCFTVPPNKAAMLKQIMTAKYTRIGKIEPTLGLRCMNNQQQFKLQKSGFQHF